MKALKILIIFLLLSGVVAGFWFYNSGTFNEKVREELPERRKWIN